MKTKVSKTIKMGRVFVPRPPKKTAQGSGQFSKPNHGRKLSRGQGK